MLYSLSEECTAPMPPMILIVSSEQWHAFKQAMAFPSVFIVFVSNGILAGPFGTALGTSVLSLDARVIPFGVSLSSHRLMERTWKLAHIFVVLALALFTTAHAGNIESQKPSCSISGYQLVARKLPAIKEDWLAGLHILSSNNYIGLYSGSKVKKYSDIRAAKEACDQDERCVMFTTDGWTLGIHDYGERKDAAKIHVIWPLIMHYCAGPCCGTYVSLEAAEALKAHSPGKRWKPAPRDSSGTYEDPATSAFIQFKMQRGRALRLQQCKLLQARPQKHRKCSPACRVACCVPKVFSPYAMSETDCDPSECEAAGIQLEYDQCTKHCVKDCGFLEVNAACLEEEEGCFAGNATAYLLQTLRMFYKRAKGSKAKYRSWPVQDKRGCAICP